MSAATVATFENKLKTNGRWPTEMALNDDLSLATERVRQNRAQRQADLDARGGQQATPASRASGPILAGDRVFDSLSGLYGLVVSAGDTSKPLRATVSVRLADDSVVTRRPVDLVLRPAPPSVGP